MNNSKTYELVLLDFDGTLFNTKPSIIYSTKETCRYFNAEIPSDEAIYEIITSGVRIIDALKGWENGNDIDTDKWLSTYREIYHNQGEAKSELYEGVKETLHELSTQHIHLAILSNKGIVAIEKALDQYKLSSFLSLVIGDGSIEKLKPHRMPYDEIISKRYPDVPLEKILMVGDTVLDISFGNNCGIHSCWASYGYGKAEKVQALLPTHTIASFAELKPIVSQ